MKKIITILPGFTALATALATADTSAVLGKVGDIQITSQEIRDNLAGLGAEQESALTRDDETLNQYVRALLVRRLVLEKAMAEKWDKDPAVIRKLVSARENTITESFLEAQSSPDPDYPSDAELQQAYDENKAALLVPKSYQIAQIFIAGDPASDAAAATKLAAVKTQLAAKEADFSAIARAYSEEAASAANGGVIGWLTEGQIQPEIRAKLPKLELAKTSEPIQLGDGIHILRIIDIREAHTPVLAQVRDAFVTRMRAELTKSRRQEFVAKLLREHPLAINEIELNTLLETTSN